MATDVSSITRSAQDQILAAITTTQAAIIDGVRTMSSTMASALPAVPKLPAVPGADKLPTPADAVELGFDFAARLLASQRDFAERLLDAVSPAAPAPAPKAKAGKVA